MKMNFKKGSASACRRRDGFTLIELLVVVGIIAILASVVLASLGTARDKGADGAIKSDLANARSQAEVFYNTNTASPNSYTSLCTNGLVGGAAGIGSNVLAAAKVYGLGSYDINNSAASATDATCNVSGIGDAWAAEVPLRAGGMWCVDSIGKSKAEAGSINAGTVCA